MKTYTLVESHPDPGSCRSSAIFYYVDGKRVNGHEYSLLWLKGHGGESGGYVTKGERHKSKRGRWCQYYTVYA